MLRLMGRASPPLQHRLEPVFAKSSRRSRYPTVTLGWTSSLMDVVKGSLLTTSAKTLSANTWNNSTHNLPGWRWCLSTKCSSTHQGANDMNQVPAWWNKRSTSDTSDFLSGIGSALPPHLSIGMNRFTLVDSAGNERPPVMSIDVCIIAANPYKSQIYYDPNTPFDPSGATNSPPLCWSDNGTGPSRNAAQPQSQTCVSCAKYVWGSAQSRMTGRDIPACQQSKKVAFLVPSDADDILYMFKVPPASLKNLTAYVKTLEGNKVGGRSVSPADVVTRLEFASQGVIKFTPVGLIDEDMFNRSERYYTQQDVIAQITGRDDVARDPSLPITAIQEPPQTTIRQKP